MKLGAGGRREVWVGKRLALLKERVPGSLWSPQDWRILRSTIKTNTHFALLLCQAYSQHFTNLNIIILIFTDEENEID